MSELLELHEQHEPISDSPYGFWMVDMPLYEDWPVKRIELADELINRVVTEANFSINGWQTAMPGRYYTELSNFKDSISVTWYETAATEDELPEPTIHKS